MELSILQSQQTSSYTTYQHQSHYTPVIIAFITSASLVSILQSFKVALTVHTLLPVTPKAATITVAQMSPSSGPIVI